MRELICLTFVVVLQCYRTNGLGSRHQERFTNVTLQKALDACGLDHFCSSTVPQPAMVHNILSCCGPCYCTEDCWLFADCCPDAPEPRSDLNQSITALECQQSDIQLNNRTISKVPAYRIISECPQSYGDVVTILKCEGQYNSGDVNDGDALRNYTLVSGTDGFIYRNKFCAKCYGVFEVIEWEMAAVECVPPATVNPRFYTVLENIVNHCVLVSMPPKTIDVSRAQCSSSYIGTCPLSENDAELARACEFSVFPAVYRGRFGRQGTVYSNIFCLLCNVQTLYICDGTGKDTLQTPLTELIRIDLTSTKQSTDNSQQSTCSRDAVYDKLTDTCKTVTCPITQTFIAGKCVETVIQWYGYGLGFPILVNILNESLFYSLLQGVGLDKIVLYAVNVLDLKYSCLNTCAYTMYTFDSNSSLYATLFFQIKENCTLDVIQEALVQNMFQLKISEWFFFDFATLANISIEFFPPKPVNNLSMLTSKGLCSHITLDRLFFCPFITLNETEFCRWRVGCRTCDIWEIYNWTSSSYAVIEKGETVEIHVCASDYFLSRGSAVTHKYIMTLCAYISIMLLYIL